MKQIAGTLPLLLVLLSSCPGHQNSGHVEAPVASQESGDKEVPASLKQTDEAACDSGDGQACYEVGIGSINGTDVPKDEVKARLWMEKSCESGYAKGCAELSVMLSWGLGGPQDLPRSRTLSKKACDGGEAEGCYMLGLMWQNGIAGGKDMIIAATLFERACDGGFAKACEAAQPAP